MGNTKIKIEQACIFILSVTAITLVGLPPSSPLQKYGFIIGLCSQPFWISFSYRTKAWAVLGLSLVYTLSWINGIKNNF